MSATAAGRSHSVRTYSLLGGLFGNKAEKMGASSSTQAAGAREGWAPAAGEESVVKFSTC